MQEERALRVKAEAQCVAQKASLLEHQLDATDSQLDTAVSNVQVASPLGNNCNSVSSIRLSPAVIARCLDVESERFTRLASYVTSFLASGLNVHSLSTWRQGYMSGIATMAYHVKPCFTRNFHSRFPNPPPTPCHPLLHHHLTQDNV